TAGQVWQVAENWRYAPAIQRAAEHIRAGRIGRPMMFHWAIHAGLTPDRAYYHTPWRRDGSHPHGLMLDGGVHFIAGLRTVLGEIATIQAQSAHLRDDLPPPDTLVATVRMASGLVGTLAMTYAIGLPWTTALTIAGDDGTLVVNRDALSLHHGDTVQDELHAAGDGVAAEWDAFHKAIRSGQPKPAMLASALQDIAGVEAFIAAARTGQRTHPQTIYTADAHQT
ncbi:MAG: Gfo/Idh/MocA family protein, partial [Anaerolineales bacterium]